MSILSTSVPKGHPVLEEGHWFFDEGQWLVCGSAAEISTGKWSLQISAPRFDKPLRNKELLFASLADVKKFVAGYFERPVVDCEPDRFPSPEDL